MSERIKNLLAVAAGPEAQGDGGWHAENTARLYFSNPNDLDSAGMADVHTKKEAGEPVYVRVELYVRPEIAAEIISHVTGRSLLAANAIATQEIEKQLEAHRLSLIPKKSPDADKYLSEARRRLNQEDDVRAEALTKEIKRTGGLGEGTDEDEQEDEDEPEESTS